jgi:crotonobetainyl-CoA:carnitine CoA-transferase CaiB-like acyl-CoA transferase
MVDGLISMFTFASAAFFATGELPPRNGNDHMVVSPYGLYQASDGPIAIAPSTEKTWLSLCKVLEIENLIADSRFDTNEKRRDNRAEINKIVGDRIRSRSRAEWIELLNKEGVPCGPIYNLKEAFSDPQVLHQEMVLESSQPSGKIKMPGFPVKIYGAPAKLRRPSPQAGEHTIDVLKELGYSDEEISRIQKG